jgi:Ca2+-transporting ATPase
MTDMKWYDSQVAEVAAKLNTGIERGLAAEDARARLAEHGANELAESKQASALMLFLLQFKNSLLIILLIGAALSVYTGLVADAIAITFLVFFNAIISFVQERKAQQSLQALREMGAPNALVLRDGEWLSVPAKEIVPGDILRLNTGDIVPADVRLAEASQLRLDESALTGESEPVEKQIEALAGEHVGIGDRLNMAFMSTIVSNGNGVGIVTATGMQTEVGHIADLMRTAEAVKTPMQRRLASLSHILVGAALVAVATVIGLGLNHGADLLEMMQIGISLSVAAIPSGLPTVMAIVLTMGGKRMARNQALVRQLASVETLGSTSVICSDKTGTLTQNQMQVVSTWSGGKLWQVTGQGFDPSGEFLDEQGQATDPEAFPDLKYALVISALCNRAQLKEEGGRYSVLGNPTEGALVVAAAKVGITRENLLNEGYELVKSYPFDSTRKMASVIVRDPGGRHYLIGKGAPDVIVRRSEKIHWNGDDIPLDETHQAKVHEAVEAFGSRALRTLAIAFVPLEPSELDHPQEQHENDLVLLAIHGIIDPPRPEVIAAVEQCRDAGIKTVMITGDHAATGQAIAEQIGIKHSDADRVFTGAELDAMSDRELQEVAPQSAVFARVSPEHKQRIVQALQANNLVVAMTGDGVNDAPALKNADIGVAMGIAGTQVAKDSSDLVLLDDNFSSIVAAVREGRQIYDNIRKYIRQALTSNVAEVSAVMFAFLLMGADPIAPLTALMILWINLVSDAIPALALGVDEAEPDLMSRRPRPRDESFFADNLGSRIVIRGLTIGWLAYFIFEWALMRGHDVPHAQTEAFVMVVFGQLFHIFDARTFTTLYRRNPFTNRYLLMAVAGSGLLSLAVVYLPFGNFVLGTSPLGARELVMTIAISALPTLVLSGVKEIFNIRWL